MALTRVSRHIIDEPLELQNINATGIGTFASLRVTGDLQVDGTTTTLDTVVTEVDRLEVSANSTIAAGIITQTGSGDILRLYDGASEVFSVADGGDISIVDKIVHAGDTDTAIRFPAGNTFTVETAGSERLRITSAGNIGLHGQTNPTDSLHIGDFATVGYELKLSRNALQFRRAGDSFIDQKDDAGNIVFRTTSSNTERLHITSTGRIGINQASPDAMLQVDYDEGSSEVGLRLRAYNASGSKTWQLSEINGNAGVFSIRNATNSTEGLEIHGDGHVRVPTGDLRVGDNTDSNAGTKTISVGSVSSGSGGIGIFANPTNGNSFVQFGDGTSSADQYRGYMNYRHADDSLRFGTANTDRLHINSTGNIGIGTDNPGTTLDVNGNIIIRKSNNLYFESTSGISPRLTNSVDQNSLSIFTNNTEKLSITSDGRVRIPDGGKFTAGAGDDLQIYHNGTHTVIHETNPTGNLRILASNLDLKKADDTTSYLVGAGASVTLYHNGYQKFETISTGAKVTGSLEVTQEYPSIRPTLDLNFAATKTLDRRITFTRDSIGTYVDENGLVKYASNNVPRFDHDFDTGESLGLLIEESRTNKFTLSTTIGGTGWTLQGTAADYTPNTTEVAAPDGTFTALKWNPSSIPQYLSQNLGNIGTTQSTMSVWVRCPAGQSRTFFMNLYSPSQNGGAGQFTATDQWQRFTWTFTPQSQANAYPIVPDSTGTYYIWGPQLEEGSFATSYIPTSGSTVTRAADIPKIEGTNLTSFYNDIEGTVFAEYQNLKTGDTNGRVWDIGNNQNQTFVINAASSTTVQGQFYNSSGNGYEYNPGAVSATNAFNKVALGMKNNNTNLCVNGTLGTNDTSVTLIDFSSAGTFSIGRSEHYSPRELNGCVRRLSYYNKRLPNAQLQGLTQQ